MTRSLLVLGLLGVLMAACSGGSISDSCGLETRCTGKKMTKMIAIEAEKHRKGIGVEKDLVRAFELYQIAYDRGFDGAEYRLAEAYRKGDGTERNPAKALQLYRESAESGNVGAVYRMAEMYRIGDGIEKDPEKAVQLYQRAVAVGNIGATYRLADSYRTGVGIEKDPVDDLHLKEVVPGCMHTAGNSSL